MNPKLIVDCKNIIGENPLWHPIEKKLYWVDIPNGDIYRFDPETGNHEKFYHEGVIGGFTIQEDGSLLLFMEKCTVKILKSKKTVTVIDEIPEERVTRFNDVIADPKGRVFCGTQPAENHPASIYRLDTDGSITKIIDNIGISNGFGFTSDRKHMYYTDSLKREIYIVDYNENRGTIENKRVFVANPEYMGLPDGMTVDKEGYVWSAYWDGECLVRYTYEGIEDFRVNFPVKKVTSVTFGGENYTDIFITTAGGNKRDEEGLNAGALFHLNLGIQGIPEFVSKIGI